MKKLILILMVLGITTGFSQSTISLDLPDLSGVQNGETVTIPVMASDVIMPNEISSFYIYVEWDDAVLDYVSMALSPEMEANIGFWSVLFQSGTAVAGGVETCVGGWLNTVNGSTFSINPGDVFFNITATYIGDGTTGTDLNFQFSSKDEGGLLSKGVTEIIDASFILFDLTYDVPSGGVNMAGPLANTWQGDDAIVPDDWFTAENWSAGTVPMTEDVLIPAGLLGSYPYIMGGEAMCGALEVEAGAYIQIASDGYLTAGACTLDGDLSIEEGGSFIDGGIMGAGMFDMQRTVTSAATGTIDGWHLLSSPLATSFTNWDIYDYYVNTWDETVPVWVAHEGSIPDCIPATEITASPVMGWSVKYADWYATDPCNLINPGTGMMIDFEGPAADLNTGAQSMAVTATANATAFDGYNLVGNPYPSSIDANAIVFGGDLDGTVNIYNMMDDNQYYEWTMALGSQLIAPTQGFFVHATAGTTFDLAGTERAHGGMFYKETIDNLLKLSVTGNNSYDETFVRFIEGTSAGYDLHLDANKMFGSENMPSLYTTSGGQQLAIDVQSSTDQVPMSFSSTTPGTYTIEAFEASDFTYVYLQDLQTGTVTDLLAGSHELNHTEGVQNFIIHFAPVGINDINANTVKIWALDNNIIVNVPAEVTGEIAVYNMMGQEVARTDIEAFETQIKVSDVNTNYIVKVISNSNTVTGKVYVK